MREGESERTDELDRRAIAHFGALQLLHESRLVLQLLRHAPAGGAVGTIGTAQAQLLRVSRTCCRLVAVSINSTGTISPAVPNTVLSTSVASTPARCISPAMCNKHQPHPLGEAAARAASGRTAAVAGARLRQ